MPQQDPNASRVDALEQENRRLRRAMEGMVVLNRLATAIAAARDLEAIMQTIVRQALKAVGAEQGVITLVDAASSAPAHTLVRTHASVQPAPASSPALAANPALRLEVALVEWMLQHTAPLRLNKPQQDARFKHVDWDPSVRSVLGVPMRVQDRLVGILTLFNKHDASGFGIADEQLLRILAAQSAQVLQNVRLSTEREEILRLFGQHTAPAVVEELRRLGTDSIGGRKHVCVMFLDLRGFTTFAETAPPEEVVAYLNTLFDFMIDAVTRHYGIIHQLLGDGFMAIFGAPLSHGNDCQHAVDAALEILERLAEKERAGAIPPTSIGVGLHAGEVVAGAVGSVIHKEYKITGDVVNLAARIEKMNKVFDSQLLVSEAVWKALERRPASGHDMGPLPVRGRAGEVRLYRLA